MSRVGLTPARLHTALTRLYTVEKAASTLSPGITRTASSVTHIPLAAHCAAASGARALLVRFKCAGDGRARGYFFDRYVPNREGRHKEHEWAIAYTDHEGQARESRFRGTLHLYKDKENPPNKWEFFGTIRVEMPF